MSSGLLDMRQCADPRFAAIHADMLGIDLQQQPRWFRPLLIRSRRLQGMTGYNHWSRRWEYPWAILAAEFGDRTGRTLDVGGGGSPFSRYLARAGHDSHVADPSLDRGSSFVYDADKSMTQNLRSVAKRVLFRIAGINSLWGLPQHHGESAVHYAASPADDLSYHDEHFDTVFCLSVMEHIPTALWDACMREFGRVLRPGGRLILTLDMTTPEANRRLYRRLVEGTELQLIGQPDYEVPLRSEEQQLRHPGHGYETIGLVWRKAGR
jgi:SAM-dependent methyltransferase